MRPAHIGTGLGKAGSGPFHDGPLGILIACLRSQGATVGIRAGLPVGTLLLVAVVSKNYFVAK